MINFLNEINADRRNVFRAIPLMLAPRILGQIDRKPESRTFGCADRYFWKYKLHDYVNFRFQEAAHFLALLHETPGPGNPYHKNARVKEAAGACVNYFLKNMTRDGSVTEIYPFERSYCATSFVLYAATETMLVFPEFFDERALRTAEWLFRSKKVRNPPNQEAAAALGLLNTGLLSKEDKYKEAAMDKFRALEAAMDGAGCFIEYGGRDPGYNTLTLSLISMAVKKCPDDKLSGMLERGAAFSLKSLDGHGRVEKGGGSRGNQFVYPYFIAAMKCGELLGRVLDGLMAYDGLNPLWVDDRYTATYAINYLQTYAELKGAEGTCAPGN